MILLLIIIVTSWVFFVSGNGLEKSFRDAAFQIISLITTTGFVSADYTAWGNPMVMLFFILLFSGACAGSTSGGIKIIRHLAIFKNSILEFKRLLHPKAIIRTKIDQQVVSGRIMTHILVFLLVLFFIVCHWCNSSKYFRIGFYDSFGCYGYFAGQRGACYWRSRAY